MKRKLTKVNRNPSLDVSGGFSAINDIVIERKEMMNLSHNTLKGYGRVFTSLYEYFGDRPDAMYITHEEARSFIRWLQTDKVHYKDRFHNEGIQRGIKPSTINTYLKLCKTIYNELVLAGYIEINPFEGIPCMKRDKEKIKTIPKEDLRLLIESLNTAYYTEFRLYVAIHVLLDTFGRIDEVLSIKKTDIDFDKKTIYFSKTKTNDPRYVGFSNRTKKLILELIEECREFNTVYLFVGVNGEKFQPEAFRANLKRYSNYYGIKTHITPHMFRHTAAMLFLENGGNMRVLQKILGHRKIATTEIYAHVSENLQMLQQESYSPLDQVLKGEKKYNKARNRRIR
ncbi:tyrosine-type recombinase/integrase [Macrococcus capreoli]|uniref:tyrosine-type recombinase/integrase n=1 Tax=Macrococcus capreoli TaxID=2982690 RepID=UPI0021D6083F|nr:tyrosine-type recombinase/integrase [Macrococcus sp. TMW 2.2395]MCU7556606.1 tyrosine-type recombinase/integrase [Macrococcus sp. TMW 2.2395]